MLALAWEWPVKQFAGTWLHQSIELRLLLLPLLSLTCVLMYQSTDAGLYYLIGMAIYFWAYSEGEVCIQNGPLLATPLTDWPDCLRKALGAPEAQ